MIINSPTYLFDFMYIFVELYRNPKSLMNIVAQLYLIVFSTKWLISKLPSGKMIWITFYWNFSSQTNVDGDKLFSPEPECGWHSDGDPQLLRLFHLHERQVCIPKKERSWPDIWKLRGQRAVSVVVLCSYGRLCLPSSVAGWPFWLTYRESGFECVLRTFKNGQNEIVYWFVIFY